jgi:hypothetical protein
VYKNGGSYMDIQEYIKGFKNYPILCVGAGLGLRYYKDYYNWDGLLRKVCYDLTKGDDYYLNLKSKFKVDYKFLYDKVASQVEREFNARLEVERDGEFKYINDIFFEGMVKGINISRFKIYVSEILKGISLCVDKSGEILEFRRAGKNIGSIITTNYDKFLEETLDFHSYVGNDIFMSSPYGSVYKIQGCVSRPDKLVITYEDYASGARMNERLRCYLSMLVNNPIIFIGYSTGDKHIMDVLRTVFTYVDPNSKEGERISKNILIVEYGENSQRVDIIENDIYIGDSIVIKVNKVRTDNYIEVYRALSEIQLPVSVKDIRTVQKVMQGVYDGKGIKVNIAEDIGDLGDGKLVLDIGRDG